MYHASYTKIATLCYFGICRIVYKGSSFSHTDNGNQRKFNKLQWPRGLRTLGQGYRDCNLAPCIKYVSDSIFCVALCKHSCSSGSILGLKRLPNDNMMLSHNKFWTGKGQRTRVLPA